MSRPTDHDPDCPDCWGTGHFRGLGAPCGCRPSSELERFEPIAHRDYGVPAEALDDLPTVPTGRMLLPFDDGEDLA